MPTKNKPRVAVKPVAAKPGCGIPCDIHKLGRKMREELKVLKKKYDQMDDRSKKRLVVGLASITALLIGVKAVKSAAKKGGAKKK